MYQQLIDNEYDSPIRMADVLESIIIEKAEARGMRDMTKASEFPEYAKALECAEYAIDNYDCENAENRSIYNILAILYLLVTNAIGRVSNYVQHAVNLGIEGADNILQNIKTGKKWQIIDKVAGTVANATGFGAAYDVGHALADADFDKLIDSGKNLLGSLFGN